MLHPLLSKAFNEYDLTIWRKGDDLQIGRKPNDNELQWLKENKPQLLNECKLVEAEKVGGTLKRIIAICSPIKSPHCLKCQMTVVMMNKLGVMGCVHHFRELVDMLVNQAQVKLGWRRWFVPKQLIRKSAERMLSAAIQIETRRTKNRK